MTPRSIRRAAERKSQKEARKAARNSELPATANHPFETPKPEARETTPAQLTANRANARKSTGPRTEEGKLRVRHNAVRHALTGRTILLPTDEAILYENHCQALHSEFKPAGTRESLLVQNIADHHWRLSRIPALEAGIYAIAREQSADRLEAQTAEIRIYIAYEKQLRNLQTQQARLTRYLQKDMAELEALQQARVEEERQEFERAAALAAEAANQGHAFYPEEFGFVFSTADLKAYSDAKGNLALAKKLIQQRATRPSSLAQAA